MRSFLFTATLIFGISQSRPGGEWKTDDCKSARKLREYINRTWKQLYGEHQHIDPEDPQLPWLFLQWKTANDDIVTARVVADATRWYNRHQDKLRDDSLNVQVQIGDPDTSKAVTKYWLQWKPLPPKYPCLSFGESWDCTTPKLSFQPREVEPMLKRKCETTVTDDNGKTVAVPIESSRYRVENGIYPATEKEDAVQKAVVPMKASRTRFENGIYPAEEEWTTKDCESAKKLREYIENTWEKQHLDPNDPYHRDQWLFLRWKNLFDHIVTARVVATANRWLDSKKIWIEDSIIVKVQIEDKIRWLKWVPVWAEYPILSLDPKVRKMNIAKLPFESPRKDNPMLKRKCENTIEDSRNLVARSVAALGPIPTSGPI